MKRLLAVFGMLAIFASAPLSALAATYIQDNGNMFGQAAKNQATQQIDNLVQRTGKEIVVYTVASLNGQDASAAADNIFRSQRVNGVLFFMSNQDHRLEMKVGQDTRGVISTSRETQIRDTVLADFRANNFDKGLLDGVNAASNAMLTAAGPSGANARPAQQSGPNWVLIGLLVIGGLLVVWIIGGIMNARRQQPYFSYGQQQGPGYGGYGQPGGMGWGGGGGGFFSGLMGGLGGALLGNALFDAFRPRDRFDGYPGGYQQGPMDAQQGWMQDDAGQVSDSGADGGSWDSGGGGDFGGGGDSGSSGGGDW